MAEAPQGRTLFIVAGEPSGDMLGARIMRALQALDPALRFEGVGGPGMIGEGLESRFAMDELSLIGLAEILPHARHLMRRLGEAEAAARALRPDAVLTIDSPGFSLRLQRRLKGAGVRRIHYVAPQVWAWREGRARRLAHEIDHCLALLPFEPAFFARHGLDCQFVGHPILEEVRAGDGAAFRSRHGIDPSAPLLCLLPGSRRSEVRRHLPILGEAIWQLKERVPGLHLVLPTLGSVTEAVEVGVAPWAVRPLIVTDRAARFDAYAASTAAIAASGTISLEVALAGLPYVTIYRLNAVSAWLARRLIRVPFVNLANLVLGRKAVPELLQDRCTGTVIATEVERLLHPGEVRTAQLEALREVKGRLAGDDPRSPSERAAAAVMALIGGDSGVARSSQGRTS